MTDSAQRPRPLGISSRARVASGPHHRWRAGNGEMLTLPIIIEYVVTDDDGVAVRIEATIDVRRGQLITASINLWARGAARVNSPMSSSLRSPPNTCVWAVGMPGASFVLTSDPSPHRPR